MTRRKYKLKNADRYHELMDKYVVKQNEPPIQWKILDEAKALTYHITTIGFGNNTILIVDHHYLPEGITAENALDWVIEQGIAVNKAI